MFLSFIPKTTSTPIPSGSLALVIKPPPGVVNSSISPNAAELLSVFRSSIEAALKAVEINFFSPFLHISMNC